MPAPLLLERDGVRLGGLDFGGNGPPALLLHGLAGHAGEWSETAGWLSARCRVVALDARGHGGSERLPEDVSREAHAADAGFVLEALGLSRAVVVGQSLGGLTALLLAADRPDLVRALVMVEAAPGDRTDAAAVEANVAELRRSLARWPIPFASRQVAAEFFGGSGANAEAWADGLEQRGMGWWPRFEVEVMARTLREATARGYWEEWERVSCPVLAVRGGNGQLTVADTAEMVRRGQDVRAEAVAAAGHDVHLDRPAEWRAVLEAFLDELEEPAN